MNKIKLIYKGRIITLFKKKIKLPNHYITTLEIIQHPGAVLVIPFLSKNKMIFIRQFRAVINKYIYELPAGTLNIGEKPLLCARREIIEETGYAAKKLIRLGAIYPVPGYSTEKISIYKAIDLIKKQKQTDVDEVLENRIFTRTKVKSLFKQGKIVDAKTISALAFCGWL